MRILITAALVAGTAFSQSAGDNPQLASAKSFYMVVRGNVLKAAEKMPEEKYGFKPVDDVRSFGQMLAHIADGQYFFCGAAKQDSAASRGIEKSTTAKADIIKALNEAYAYCDGVYAGLTDASSAAQVKFLGQERTKLAILSFNTAHTFEHYGNLATYLRINRLVPPSSERPPAAAPAR